MSTTHEQQAAANKRQEELDRINKERAGRFIDGGFDLPRWEIYHGPQARDTSTPGPSMEASPSLEDRLKDKGMKPGWYCQYDKNDQKKTHPSIIVEVKSDGSIHYRGGKGSFLERAAKFYDMAMQDMILKGVDTVKLSFDGNERPSEAIMTLFLNKAKEYGRKVDMTDQYIQAFIHKKSLMTDNTRFIEQADIVNALADVTQAELKHKDHGVFKRMTDELHGEKKIGTEIETEIQKEKDQTKQLELIEEQLKAIDKRMETVEKAKVEIEKYYNMYDKSLAPPDPANPGSPDVSLLNIKTDKPNIQSFLKHVKKYDPNNPKSKFEVESDNRLEPEQLAKLHGDGETRRNALYGELQKEVDDLKKCSDICKGIITTISGSCDIGSEDDKKQKAPIKAKADEVLKTQKKTEENLHKVGELDNSGHLKIKEKLQERDESLKARMPTPAAAANRRTL